MRRLVFLCPILLAVGSLIAAEPIVTTDLLRVRTVSSIDVSADGTKAVFAVHSIQTMQPDEPALQADPSAEPTYSNRSHLFLLDLTKTPPLVRQATHGPRFDVAPVISPDGRRIAFVRMPEYEPGSDEFRGQVWVMPFDGGEARQVTDMKFGAGAPQWSPDGTRLLVNSKVPMHELDGEPPWPIERPKRAHRDSGDGRAPAARPDGTRTEIRAWLDRNAERTNPFVFNRLEFQDEHSLREPMRFSHLFLVDPDADRPNARRITDGFFDHTQAVFAGTNGRIVFTANKQTQQHPDRVISTDLWTINADGSGDELLLHQDGWSLSEPRPSRDGTVIAFLGERTDEPAFRQRMLGMTAMKAPGVDADGEQPPPEPVWLTVENSFDSSVFEARWLAADSSIAFNTARQGGFPLYSITTGTIEPAPLIEQVDGHPIGVHAFAAGGGTIIYAQTSPANPCVLRVRDARSDRLVYDLNPWVNEKTTSMPREAWITRPDGTRVQYWLMEPTLRDPAPAKYPLAVQIHGGPSAMWGPGEDTMWHEFQLLASWGYGVVYCNPRGSGGYGYDFQKRNFQNWGDGPAGDVLAVVDDVLAKHEWIDKDRLVVTGGSYAGYLTAWIVSHDHRFKAAAAQRGVYDLDTFFGEGNAWRLVEWAFGGWPWEARVRPVLQRESPFTHVNRIRTPLLILHASQDLRTGVSQSEMLYRALKVMGRDVEYVRYPDAGHDLSRTGDPLQRMDRLNRIIEFFERFIENPRAAPVLASPQS